MDRRITHVMRTFTAVFEQKASCWIGWIEELPGANTQGSTLDETRENLKEAVRLMVDSNRSLAGNHSQEGTVIREELLVNV
jgi:predicted RNase H-like HicB family nuclease